MNNFNVWVIPNSTGAMPCLMRHYWVSFFWEPIRQSLSVNNRSVKKKPGFNEIGPHNTPPRNRFLLWIDFSRKKWYFRGAPSTGLLQGLNHFPCRFPTHKVYGIKLQTLLHLNSFTGTQFFGKEIYRFIFHDRWYFIALLVGIMNSISAAYAFLMINNYQNCKRSRNVISRYKKLMSIKSLNKIVLD